MLQGSRDHTLHRDERLVFPIRERLAGVPCIWISPARPPPPRKLASSVLPIAAGDLAIPAPSTIGRAPVLVTSRSERQIAALEPNVAAASGRNEESVVGCRRRCRTGFSKLHKVLGPDAQSAGDAKWVWQRPCLILLREKTVHRIGAIAGSRKVYGGDESQWRR